VLPAASLGLAIKGTTGRATAEKLITTFPTCPIPEVARLGRTLRQWRSQVLAYFATSGVSNGGTEAIDPLIEETRRLAHGFRNLDNYRLRILLVADESRPCRQRPNRAQWRGAGLVRPDEPLGRHIEEISPFAGAAG
jgi:hypothetical protein